MSKLEPTSSIEVKPANMRGAARLGAVQALYQMDVGGTSLEKTIAEYEEVRLGKEIDEEQYLAADHGWFRGVLNGVVANQKTLDPVIHHALKEGWPLKRIDSLLRAILRAGTFELMERKDVPAKVIINEYLDVANAYYNEDEPKIVNGVLDVIAHKIRADEFKEK